MTRRIVVPALVSVLLLGALSAYGQQTPAAKPSTTLKVGDVAPDFTLVDQSRNKVRLSDFRGKQSVVLAFYVLAFTGG